VTPQQGAARTTDPTGQGISARAVGDALAAAGLLVARHGEMPSTFSSVTDDSRAVGAGALFVAVRGTSQDGHAYLSVAERAGAAAAIVEVPTVTGLPTFEVTDARVAASVAASVANGEPARALRSTVAVTGTNGKSTTVGILRHLLDEPTARSASIGTIGVFVGSAGEPLPGGGGLTTPGPIELQRVLRALVDRGVVSLAMEVSSHSLDQRRIAGMAIDAAVFTNLTRDHLDYHGTMDEYFAAKAKLLTYLRPAGACVLNADDTTWRRLPQTHRTVRFSADGLDADIRASGIQFGPRGSEWVLEVAGQPTRVPVRLPLIGDFNVANALAAAAAAWALGVGADTVAERLSTVPQIPGRLEVLHDSPTVLRDYAHTPDALERALHAVRPFTAGRLIVVFGAGGDRDRGKRPQMGSIVERLADVAIVTSDNPRTEDPERILDDIEHGMTRAHERLEDRGRAVARAIELAGPQDLIVLAGKGHETYQVRGTTAYPFDERALVRAAYAAR
jgi:UDP-N-acetylmuramoyl-L-alanyl-D-glutamate--2,6-diaminopimelate ligase